MSAPDLVGRQSDRLTVIIRVCGSGPCCSIPVVYTFKIHSESDCLVSSTQYLPLRSQRGGHLLCLRQCHSFLTGIPASTFALISRPAPYPATAFLNKVSRVMLSKHWSQVATLLHGSQTGGKARVIIKYGSHYFLDLIHCSPLAHSAPVTCQTSFHPRTLALTLFSAWKALLLGIGLPQVFA